MDYLYIQAWEKMMGALPNYVEAQMAQARKDGAPETAIYKANDGTWQTFEGIKREDTKQKIQEMVGQMIARKKG